MIKVNKLCKTFASYSVIYSLIDFIYLFHTLYQNNSPQIDYIHNKNYSLIETLFKYINCSSNNKVENITLYEHLPWNSERIPQREREREENLNKVNNAYFYVHEHIFLSLSFLSNLVNWLQLKVIQGGDELSEVSPVNFFGILITAFYFIYPIMTSFYFHLSFLGVSSISVYLKTINFIWRLTQ